MTLSRECLRIVRITVMEIASKRVLDLFFNELRREGRALTERPALMELFWNRVFLRV